MSRLSARLLGAALAIASIAFAPTPASAAAFSPGNVVVYRIGDGKADLLWQNVDGRAAIWLMNGSTPSATAQILNAGSGWSVVATRTSTATARPTSCGATPTAV